ncbi:MULTISPECIES: hypothetical protein [Spiroplasma]|uniref:Spiroplasmavirus-related protein n=2 Tax=Spiroplasma melliferum TaxID=2134 RepID=A0AAI9T2T8_SPIME|nr:hypothetical protein [Spiroplasma melliferum]KAI92458.1 hypothetical protein SPM_004635 [Spiroplasma melliferum KC3]KAI93133.1 hypothetical protein SPM_001695 [Spiroplasma melliferum KC3]QCO23339.1 Spiroplasmavirus-related protein [Spiroplasma melliferum]QCO24380.1 Spiroplasmavirus-related protein [Spiroplasma melliferum]
MKSKILKFLKEKWWKILLYFLVISLGMFVPFLYIDIKEFQLFLSKFGSVSSIMCIGYIIFWILTAAGIIDLILWIKKKINKDIVKGGKE